MDKQEKENYRDITYPYYVAMIKKFICTQYEEGLISKGVVYDVVAEDQCVAVFVEFTAILISSFTDGSYEAY